MTADIATVNHDTNRIRGALIVADALTQEADQRKLLGQYVSQQMIEGTDYGIIPGTERKNKDGSAAPTPKTLLKPGAEKLTQLFRCVPRYTVEEKIENWESGLFYYRFTCRVVNQDEAVVAEGVGSCSTYESRYRWRKADRACPNCGEACIKRSKFPPRDQPTAEPGWYCYGAIGGCGANFDADADEITSQAVGRVQNPDLIDQVNTVLKIAKKRALVDAAISLARCSDMFTQDMDDEAEPAKPAAKPAPQQAPKSDPKPHQPRTAVNDSDTYVALARAKRFKFSAALAWVNTNLGTGYAAGTDYMDLTEAARVKLVAHMQTLPDGGSEAKPEPPKAATPPDRGDAWEGDSYTPPEPNDDPLAELTNNSTGVPH